MGDDAPLGSSSSEGGNSMSTTTVIWIAVGCVFVALVILFLVLWLVCRRRSMRRRRRRESVTGEIKIPTLGTHYKIASIQSVHGGMTPDRKFSLASDRKFSESSQREHDALLGTNSFAEEILGHSSIQGQPIPMETDEDAIETDASDMESKYEVEVSQLSVSKAGKQNRSGSTYLDFSTAVSPPSRKGSATSELLSMTEIESQSKEGSHSLHPDEVGAPLAREESLPSLRASDDSLFAPVIPVKAHRGESKRPRSDYQSEAGRFIPKLPPKKKRFPQHHQSTTDVILESDRLQSQTRKATSRSESNLFGVDDDLDYDDLPESDRAGRLPILPPKTRPRLPPKQKINKSQDDLARIETQFKSSLSELRSADAELDYDDLPDEEKEEKKEKRVDAHVNNNNEYDDYDDPPIHHSAVSEYDDYDDPIHHSRA